MQKQISKFERKHSSDGNPLVHNVFGSPVKKANKPVKKATPRKKSDIHRKNDQKSEKKQNDNCAQILLLQIC